MSTYIQNKKNRSITPAEKRLIDQTAKKIVKQYGKTLELLAKE